MSYESFVDDSFGPTADFSRLIVLKIPRQKLINAALLVAVDEGGERAGRIGQRIDAIQFTGLDQRGDGGPVLGPGIMPRNECVLPIERNWLDGPLDSVVVDLHAAVGQEELQPSQYLAMQANASPNGDFVATRARGGRATPGYRRSVALIVPVARQGEPLDQGLAVRIRYDTVRRSP